MCETTEVWKLKKRETKNHFITYMVIYLSYVDSFLDSRVHVPVRVSINKLNFIRAGGGQLARLETVDVYVRAKHICL